MTATLGCATLIKDSLAESIQLTIKYVWFLTAAQAMSATLGRDSTTGDLVTIGDLQRRSGLYILGRSGMGKSWLIVNLILQDIENEHGVLFLDPHGKGIDELEERIDPRHLDNVLLFDPEDKTHSFGINLLSCKDIDDITERQATYVRAKGVFDKIWKNAYYDLPWLQMILEFFIYTFIENQDYTLSEVVSPTGSATGATARNNTPLSGNQKTGFLNQPAEFPAP